jgi:glycosyltransferase involved in cell wall biosynthesis
MSTDINVKISVVVPIYNIESYLPDCIDSLINQTFKNIEIILVDDGSPDNCGKICDDYASRDERIRVIHKVNGGPVSARNAGYEASTGNWITYLDGDDWLDLKLCEVLAGYVIRIEDVDVIFWPLIPYRKSWIETGWKLDTYERLYVGDECRNLAYHTLVYKSGISMPVCKLLRKDFAKKYGLSYNVNFRQGIEGLEFSLRVFISAKKVLFIKEYGYHYRYNPTSISKRIDKENTKFIANEFSEIRKYILNFPESECFLSAFYQRVLHGLIGVTMGTYFHRNNKDSIKDKIEVFRDMLDEYTIFREALRKGSFSGMDMYRKVTLLVIKWRCYILIPIISNLKYFIVRR